MTIKFKNGDMFSEHVEALVNTVNCVGVMGKGVALEFKKRWPENYKKYKSICAKKGLRPGQIFIFDNGSMFDSDDPRYLINFPTKDHWKAKSKISYVEEGLDALALEVKSLGIKTIAMPPLGCGNGGLKWDEVKPLIISKLGHLENIDIIVFEPFEAREAPEFSETTLPMTKGRAILLKTLGDIEKYFDGSFDRVSLQKIAYFVQALGFDLNLKFSRNLHGPYSDALRKSYISLEKHGLIEGFVEGDRLSKVTPAGYAVADEFISNNLENAAILIERLDHLIQGYESPYGLELLSSVHWLAHHEKHAPVEKIIAEMATWNENKRNLFQEDAIREAYKRLEDDGLLN